MMLNNTDDTEFYNKIISLFASKILNKTFDQTNLIIVSNNIIIVQVLDLFTELINEYNPDFEEILNEDDNVVQTIEYITQIT